MAGYSQKPLIDKLGIKAGMKLRIINVPDHYFKLIGTLPKGTRVVSEENDPVEFIHFFIKNMAELEKMLPNVIKSLSNKGMIWVSWYKKSSGMYTDVSEDLLRATALPVGLVDVKVCAVDDQWSGLKSVIRNANRLQSQKEF